MNTLVTFKKSILFFIRNSRHPLFLAHYLYYYWQQGFPVSASFLNEEEMLQSIREGKSLIRIGDGEIGLLTDKGITGSVFIQRPLPIFKNSLKKMITSYSDDSRYVLAIPKKYISYLNKELRSEGKVRSWLPLKIMYKLLFPKNMKYADAHIFYIPKFFENKVLPIIKNKTVIFVINETKIEKLQQKNITDKVYFIKSPASNAGDSYSEIKNKMRETIDLCKSENPLLLFSCGPIGKVLLYEFTQKGYQGIDVGEGANVLYEDTKIDYLV